MRLFQENIEIDFSRKIDFLFPVGKMWFQSLMRILGVFFGTEKKIKVQKQRPLHIQET